MAEVEGEGELFEGGDGGGVDLALGVAVGEEAVEAAGLGFVGVDGEGVVAAAAGVDDVVAATADGAFVPAVDDVDGEGGVDADGGVQAVGWLPGAVADTGDVFADGAGGMKGDGAAVAGDGVAVADEALGFDLQALEGGVDVADGAAGGAFLAEDMPGFEGGAEFDVDAALVDLADVREAEFEVGEEPVVPHEVAGFGHVFHDISEVLPDEVGEEEAVVEFGAPADEFFLVRLLPEAGDGGAQQEVLGEAHFRVGGHFEAAEFDEAEAAGGAVGGEEFVDAEFGAVGIAADVGEEVAEDAVDKPGWDFAKFGDLVEGDFEFVEGVVAGLVDTGCLGGGADEEAAEEVGEGGVIVPVGEEGAEEVRAAEEGAV